MKQALRWAGENAVTLVKFLLAIQGIVCCFQNLSSCYFFWTSCFPFVYALVPIRASSLFESSAPWSSTPVTSVQALAYISYVGMCLLALCKHLAGFWCKSEVLVYFLARMQLSPLQFECSLMFKPFYPALIKPCDLPLNYRRNSVLVALTRRGNQFSTREIHFVTCWKLWQRLPAFRLAFAYSCVFG